MTDVTPPTVTFVTERIAHWAEVRPDAEAIRFGDRRWSWAEWYERVRRAGGALGALGVGPGGRVAVLDKNHPACLEVLLGAGLVGAGCAVVNWRLAGDELDYVINDCGATVLFVGAELMPTITMIRDKLAVVTDVIVVGDSTGDSAGGPGLGYVDGYEALLAAAEPAEQDPGVSEDDLWLVIYSSGTTGRPKGVMLSHRNIVAHTVNVGQGLAMGRDPADRSLVAMPLFHVGGTCYALFGIYAGLPSTMVRGANPESLLAGFASGVTHAFLVPAVIATVLAAGERTVAALDGLKYLAYGAAPMPVPLLRKAMAAWPALNFVQVYGQTEVSGVVTTLDPAAHRDQSRPERLDSAGTLVPGAEIRVVNPATGTDVGSGESGELWFRTPQQMIGYLNRPDATAETIVEGGWLRSGDIGYVDDGGFVFISDRLKDMIITGGENVYSQEVEQAIAAHPAVAEVAVIGIPDDHWGESVKAIVALLPGASAQPEDIIAFTGERLARYKCPRTLDIVAALPRNPNGKVLKRELRQKYWQGRARQV